MPHVRLCQIGVGAAFLAIAAGAAPEFEVRFTSGVHDGPISARVYVMLGPAKAEPGRRSEPRFGPDWFHPRPFFAVDARDWKPGEPLELGDSAAGFPGRLDTIAPGDYSAQAVIRLNPDTHKIGDGVGNAFGPVSVISIGPKSADGPPIALTVDAVVPSRTFPETGRLKFVEIASPILSAFHRRPITHRAAVILPASGDRKKGTLYIIPGFGGDAFHQAERIADSGGFGSELIRVVLDPDCGTGHHAFADSAFNGPRGKALVEELIPHIETAFGANRSPRTRLLNGHSSGGWSSLWLQVTYPDEFGGVWLTSPDPVDFRDFQKIDLYAPGENMFRDPDGRRRPIARRGTCAVLFYDSFSRMEDVIGDGGQLHSFEAVFSPLGPDGRPRPSGTGPPARSTATSPAPGSRTTSASSSNGTGPGSARSFKASFTSSSATSTPFISKAPSHSSSRPSATSVVTPT